jgi:DNA-binding Lrp family transcriptional regulator
MVRETHPTEDFSEPKGVLVGWVEDMVRGAPTASQDRLESLTSANRAKGLAAATLAKPGQLVYISWRLGRPRMLSEMDKKVILALQRDLAICPRPFVEVAESLGIEEEALLAVIRSLMDRGYIRRFGATLRHQQSGYEAHLAGQRTVTHCYARRPAPTWPYNLYTMIHGRTPEECVQIAAQMAAETGISDYEMLFSETELKKTTMRYFKEGEAGSG